MSGSPSFWGAFADGSGAAAPLARILADMQAVPAVAEMKRRSFEHLRLEPGNRVLDVGSGLGHDVELLLRLVEPGGEAVGLEPNEQLLERARREHAGRFVSGHADRLPFPDASFDACRADRVVGYFARTVASLKEMGRVVRPGHRVAVSEMRFVLRGRAADQSGHELLFRHLYGEHPQGWIGYFLPLLMRRAGLREVELDEAERRVGDVDDVRRCLGIDAVLQTLAGGERDRLRSWWERLGEDVVDGESWLTLHYFTFVGVASQEAG